MDKLIIEVQVQPTDSKSWKDQGYTYQMIATLRRAGSSWTSRPAKLEAQTEEDAHQEALEKAKAYVSAILAIGV
jgi:hypothetical protein